MVYITWDYNGHCLGYWCSNICSSDNDQIKKSPRYMECPKIPTDAIPRSEAKQILLGTSKHSQEVPTFVTASIPINIIIELQSVRGYYHYDDNFKTTASVEAI